VEPDGGRLNRRVHAAVPCLVLGCSQEVLGLIDRVRLNLGAKRELRREPG
jgi:hypothetical protein